MQIRPTEYHSSIEQARAAHLTADREILVTLETSNDQLIWLPGSTMLLPENIATPLPRVALDYAYYRLRLNYPIPVMVNIAISGSAPETEDLAVPDLIKTRSTAIERDEDGNISKIIKDGGREIDITRDEGGNVATLDDGTRTWSLNRDEDGNIEEVVVE